MVADNHYRSGVVFMCCVTVFNMLPSQSGAKTFVRYTFPSVLVNADTSFTSDEVSEGSPVDLLISDCI